MQTLKKASQLQAGLIACPDPDVLYECRTNKTELEFGLTHHLCLSSKGKSDKFTGRICGVAPTRSNTLFIVGVVENGPEHTFMFSAEWDPSTKTGEIAFHNGSDPELNCASEQPLSRAA